MPPNLYAKPAVSMLGANALLGSRQHRFPSINREYSPSSKVRWIGDRWCPRSLFDMRENAFDDGGIFDAGAVHGSTNAAGAWMRSSDR